jgi:hypothetical protein
MNRPPLRLARPGQLPAPATGDDSLQVLSHAIDSLAQIRTAYRLGDSAVHLHALANLITQAEQLLPQAVHDARDQELTWAQIGELLGTTPPQQPAATGTSHDQLDKDHRHNAAVRYIGTAECLPVGFLYDEIADPRSLATRRDVATLAASKL